MTYKEITFTILAGAEYRKDLLIDALAGIGFDTFEETEPGFKAYIPSAAFDEKALSRLVTDSKKEGFDFSVHTHEIAPENWNAVWESNFQPLLIAGRCYIRATFHEARPEYPFEIVIDPKMAFGTGHHETTSLMISYLLDEDLAGRNVLDMGCGTAILAILAAKAGAAKCTAIDNDPVSYESAVENCQINHTAHITCICGSAESIPGETFDVIVANINRNILLLQLGHYAAALRPGGTLLISGFYEHPDLEMLVSGAAEHQFSFAGHRREGTWAAARFKRNP